MDRDLKIKDEPTGIKLEKDSSNATDETAEGPPVAKEEMVKLNRSRTKPPAQDRGHFSVQDLSLRSVLDQSKSLTTSPAPETVQRSKPGEKYFIVKVTSNVPQTCLQCKLTGRILYVAFQESGSSYVCNDQCLFALKQNANNCILVWQSVYGENIMQKVIYHKQCFLCKKQVKPIEENNCLTWQFLDFCNVNCLMTYQNAVCVNCKLKPSHGNFCLRSSPKIMQFCSSKCRDYHKNNYMICRFCHTSFTSLPTVTYDYRQFCSKNCMEKFVNIKNPLPPRNNVKCQLCSTDTIGNIEFNSMNLYSWNQKSYFCSEKCFVGFIFFNDISTSKCCMCLKYFPSDVLEKYFLYFDNVGYGFCSDGCKNVFIDSNKKIVACSFCQERRYHFELIQCKKSGAAVNVCSLTCLNLFQNPVIVSQTTFCDHCQNILPIVVYLTMSDSSTRSFCSVACSLQFQTKFRNKNIFPIGEPRILTNFKPPSALVSGNEENRSGQITQTLIKHHIIFKPAPLKQQRNVATMCKVGHSDKDTSTANISFQNQFSQTEKTSPEKILIPVPIPIYVPIPLPSYAAPMPYALPIPIPMPIPIFLATPRNTIKGVMKELKLIQTRTPENDFEADLVAMAGVAAGGTNDSISQNSSSADEDDQALNLNKSFGDEVLDLTLKMVSDSDEPSANDLVPYVEESLTKKRKLSLSESEEESQSSSNNKLRSSTFTSADVLPIFSKCDDSNYLKSTFGVNAWKQWALTKNSNTKVEILDLTVTELNLSLADFAKEVRKPNGRQYAPDTVFYLCLGIQKYLFENHRPDSIFFDSVYYKDFIETLNDILQKFTKLYDDSHYIVTRVEEEHLWECRQLGAHSPSVLLNTLLFFNTKYFGLGTLEDHGKISFSHIVKQWRKNKLKTNDGAGRKLTLRFYPPKNITQDATKKKMYEMPGNQENPLRCPVSLFEFYLSKCPDLVKSRNDILYLEPERSCLPESPVWYSSAELAKEELNKYFNRIRIVKEVNIALLEGDQ